MLKNKIKLVQLESESGRACDLINLYISYMQYFLIIVLDMVTY